MKPKAEVTIFLAHASEDKVRVIELYNKLKGQGYSPWLDKIDLMPGQQWRNEIPKALKKSDIFIACLSETSIKKRGYVQGEYRLALRQAAEMPADAIFLIPLKFDECEIPDLEQAEYGIKFKDFQWLDYWEAGAFERLVKAIEHGRGKLEVLAKEGGQENKSEIAKSQQFEIVTVDETGKIIKRESRAAKYFSEDLGHGVSLEMMLIPSGRFTMGAPTTEERSYDAERPQHEVSISSFYMGRYPITQAQWKAIAELVPVDKELNSDPSKFKDSYEGQQRWIRPVEKISWYDAVEFCQRLSRETGKEYRLPSEAEWEYACRAGTTTPFHFGETIITDVANYRGTDWEYEGTIYPGNYGKGVKGIYRRQTTPVGYFGVANDFGLSELHGNVWEWCLDKWHDNYEGAPKDGKAWIDNNHSHKKCLRGGSWNYTPRYCRSACRINFHPGLVNFNFGFRVVCVGAGLFPSAL